MVEYFGLSFASLALIMLATFATAVLHGATGLAGGIVLAAILSHLVGVKQAIVLVTCAMILSHASRAYFNIRDADWDCVKTVVIFSAPTIALGATMFAGLSSTVVAGLMAAILTISFPLKRFARRNSMRTTQPVLATASSFWGLLAGNVVGPGFVLTPFLLGTGMNRLTFVGTLAVIVLVMNVVKTLVFGVTDLLDAPMLWLGVIIGLVTIPANWLGREVLRRINDGHHALAVDLMTVAVIINFIYLALVP